MTRRTVAAWVVAAFVVPVVVCPMEAKSEDVSAMPTWASEMLAERSKVIAPALAFIAGEQKRMILQGVPVPAAPGTAKQAEMFLDALEHQAQEAREAFEEVTRFGSPYWNAAAEVRIGDVFHCQAEKIVAIPPPPNIPAQALPQYREVIGSLAQPLRDQGRKHWAEAVRIAKDTPITLGWRDIAQRRLEGKLPNC